MFVLSSELIQKWFLTLFYRVKCGDSFHVCVYNDDHQNVHDAFFSTHGVSVDDLQHTHFRILIYGEA